MNICILYHDRDENTRMVEDFAKDFNKRTGSEVQLLSLESIEGARLAEVHDIVSYPAILVLRDDGQLQKAWEGNLLPTVDEVAGYATVPV